MENFGTVGTRGTVVLGICGGVAGGVHGRGAGGDAGYSVVKVRARKLSGPRVNCSIGAAEVKWICGLFLGRVAES